MAPGGAGSVRGTCCAGRGPLILGLEWGRAIDAGLPPQTWSRNSKWVFYDEQLLIRIQLGMDGGHIAESNVIASSHGGEHTGHVVEENLNRALGRRVLVLPLARVEGGVRYWAWRQRCSSIWGRGFVKFLQKGHCQNREGRGSLLFHINETCSEE